MDSPQSTESKVIPSKDDMKEVVYWSARCASLTTQLFEAQEALREAWSKVPIDTEILKAPYRADIGVTCHVCGRITHWRTGRGLAQCKNDCEAKVGSLKAGRNNVSEDVWNLINSIVSAEESLDDD